MSLLIRLLVSASILLVGMTMASAPAAADAGQSLQKLLEGNQHFVKDDAKHPRQRPSNAVQHPLAVVLSCADSRVPPEVLFDQGVGDLFVVRTAGNTYDRLTLQSIAYAVDHLHTDLIIVMGHDECGAVGGAVTEYPKPDAGPMIENIYPAVKATRGQPGDPVSNAVSANAILTAQRLAAEPEFAAAVKRGALKIVAARYNLATGAVTLLSPD